TGAHKIYVCPTDAVESKGSKAGLFRQRQVYVSSYVWNGSVNSYNRLSKNKTHKLTLFNATDILQWETDENKPFFFNDVSSYPDEGISQRHGGGRASSTSQDVGGGAYVGAFGGSAERITYREFYALTGPVDARGRGMQPPAVPNELWNQPGHPKGGIP
ncbi:MAG: hypothetical protein HOI66_00895, partial [Verrucomicrobia bacterium]|nr:hypothetical protein [Verrucomicrobiota bacterium]